MFVFNVSTCYVRTIFVQSLLLLHCASFEYIRPFYRILTLIYGVPTVHDSTLKILFFCVRLTGRYKGPEKRNCSLARGQNKTKNVDVSGCLETEWPTIVHFEWIQVALVLGNSGGLKKHLKIFLRQYWTEKYFKKNLRGIFSSKFH